MVPIPVAAVLEAAPAPFRTAALPACRPEALSLHLEGGDASAGHRGALVVLRNLGARACRAPGLPRLDFTGADGRALPIRFGAPAGLHPGPAVAPVGIAPNAEVTATLSWTAPGPYDPGRCFQPAAVSLGLDGGPVRAPFGLGPVCGPPDGPALYRLGRLRPDARL